MSRLLIIVKALILSLIHVSYLIKTIWSMPIFVLSKVCVEMQLLLLAKYAYRLKSCIFLNLI
jgi:hypothetical protein